MHPAGGEQGRPWDKPPGPARCWGAACCSVPARGPTRRPTHACARARAAPGVSPTPVLNPPISQRTTPASPRALPSTACPQTVRPAAFGVLGRTPVGPSLQPPPRKRASPSWATESWTTGFFLVTLPCGPRVPKPRVRDLTTRQEASGRNPASRRESGRCPGPQAFPDEPPGARAASSLVVAVTPGDVASLSPEVWAVHTADGTMLLL